MAGTFAESLAHARPLAQHCAELTARGPRPEERAAHLAAWCRDLSFELGQELAQLFSARKLRVTVAEPETMTGAVAFEYIGPIASNSLLRCGASAAQALLSIDLSTAVALTDASFGGDGCIPEEIPAQLPRSAVLLIEQLATSIASAIALLHDPASAERGDVLARSDSAARLKPFATTDEVALFRITLAQDMGSEWSALLAVSSDRLGDLLPGLGATPASRSSGGLPDHASSAAFAAMPLEIEAVLSEFDMPLGRLHTLAPGDEIPLAIPRELPLRVGEQVFALGVLGTLDNRMAVRVMRLPGTQPHARAAGHSAEDQHTTTGVAA